MTTIPRYRRYTAKSFRALRLKLGFSADQMSALCGASCGRVVRKWEAGDNAVPEGVSRFLWALQQLPSNTEQEFIKFFVKLGKM
jgi:DNA-binding transcriptional regulator YiaG